MWEPFLSRISERQPDIAPERFADTPSLQLRWLFGIAVMVPMLLATGVYWLHHLPTGSGPVASDALIEVHLVAPGSQEPQRALIQPAPPPVLPSEPPAEEQSHVEPQAVAPPIPIAVAPPPPAAASANPGSAKALIRKASSRTASAFQRTLLAHIARFQNYPEEARRNRTQGTVQVLFAMRRNGMVTDIRVEVTSGHSELDAAAVDTIRRAQPLPVIPSELPDHLNILIPVAFDLP